MSDKLLHELFLRKVAQHPERSAIHAEKEFTYAQLAVLAQNISNELVRTERTQNGLIAVVMDKSWEQVPAVLGILMSGAAYLPIEPTESPERLQHLIEVGEVDIILTQEKLLKSIKWPKGRKIINVNSLFRETHASPQQIAVTIAPHHLAYVIFTSGSTGIPKGVMITHETAVNTILDINERFAVNASDRVLAISSLSFDLSVYDIFGTLAAGACIVFPATQDAGDPTRWSEAFFSHQISIWNSVPAIIDTFIESLIHKKIQLKNSLRLVLLSGDWISLGLPQKIRESFGGQAQVISLGGATEASIWSVIFPIDHIDPAWNSIPYGMGMKNQAIYVLDADLNLITDGAIGDLFIGGSGVSAGYWKEPERTQEQFITHTLYGRLYKTGDVGRYLLDGNVELLGRADFQIKIAGYRIEVAAIEKCLMDYEGVKQAVAMAFSNRYGKKLIAYITLNERDGSVSDSTNWSNLEKKVLNWQALYDHLFTGAMPNSDPSLNTVGWLSSYLNEPIPKHIMQEWVDDTVKRILFFKPKSVLEVGCGTGMLLFRLASATESYDAIDFSQSSIAFIEKQLEHFNIHNAKLKQLEALEISSLDSTYDMIIINSVAQYFPSLEYLTEVLNRAINQIKKGGTLFIGDVRSLAHLELFYASIPLFSTKKTELNHAGWRHFIARSTEEEEELVIDSAFFHKLKEMNPRISDVKVMLKEGLTDNEMNFFRYDVILFIEDHQPAPISVEWEAFHKELDLTHIEKKMAHSSQKIIGIKNIPNKRIAGLEPLLQMKKYEGNNWYEYCKKEIATARSKSIHPGELACLAYQYGYFPALFWSQNNLKECMDVILYKIDKGESIGTVIRRLPQSAQPDFIQYQNSLNLLANKPYQALLNKDLIKKIKVFLQVRLPHYMVPSLIFILSKFPLSSNAKIDRKALLEMHPSIKNSNYAYPRTPTEKKIGAIWKELLSIDRIDINEDFYEIGGTSLLAVGLIFKIIEIFKIELSLENIHACSSVKKLSHLIDLKNT